MSYLVLARKYRPQTFDDLVGQEQVSRTLRNALVTGRVAHAYLFAGPRGVGKTTAARLLAMALSCETEKIEERPCGKCPNCLEIQSGQAVDVIEVDGASNRGINEIRDLRETVKYRPSKGRYKVYIIDEVHALTKDAFNALLKTLEEPPGHVVFMFATTEIHKVLPTILSRCQRYDFRRIKVDDIAKRLSEVATAEGLNFEPQALEIIARQAEGGLRDSLSLMDQAIASAGGGTITAAEVEAALGLIDQTLVAKLIGAVLKGEAARALEYLEEAYLKGYDFKDLGQKILEFARSLTLVKVSGGLATLMDLTESEETILKQTAQEESLSTLNRHFNAWLRFLPDLNHHPQPRWLTEAQIIRLCQMQPLMPLSDLTARLVKLLDENPPGPRPVFVAGAPGAASPPADIPGQTAPDSPAAKKKITETADPERSSNTAASPPAGWDAFLAAAQPDLDNTYQMLLAGSSAQVFTPERVQVRLSPKTALGPTISACLEKALADVLVKQLNWRPVISLMATEPAGGQAPAVEEEGGASQLSDKIDAVKELPLVKELMAKVQGQFVDYKLISPQERQRRNEAKVADEAAAADDEAPAVEPSEDD